MGNFNDRGNRDSSFRGGSGGGRPPFQKKSWDDRPKQMHQATCSECGKPCEVPFKPTGEKPVYCTACFSTRRPDGDSRGPRKDFGDRGDRKPFGSRPSYQSTPRPSMAPSSDNGETKKQLAEISGKLDRLISAMEKLTGTAKPVAASSPVVKVSVPTASVKKVEKVVKIPTKVVAKKKPAPKAKKK